MAKCYCQPPNVIDAMATVSVCVWGGLLPPTPVPPEEGIVLGNPDEGVMFGNPNTGVVFGT